MANVNGAARLQVPVLKAPLAALVSTVAPAPVAKAPTTHVLVTPDHAFPGQLSSSTLATRVPAQLLNSVQTVKATLHAPAATDDGEVPGPQRFLGALQAGGVHAGAIVHHAYLPYITIPVRLYLHARRVACMVHGIADKIAQYDL